MRTKLISILALALSASACIEAPVDQDSAAIESSKQEIIGGVAGDPLEHPSVVAIVSQGICTGTLITPEWILTAAHCVLPEVMQLPDQQAVTNALTIFMGSSNVRSGGEEFKAAETIPHPDFNVRSLGDNDIGLIRLATPAKDRKTTPINRTRVDVGISVTQIGYGATEPGKNGGRPGGDVGILMELKSRTSTSCTTFNQPGLPPLSDENILCFAQTDGHGKCQGDSGGPSFATIDGVERVVGVTTFGDQSCAVFGADTRVSAELDFLYQHIPELACQGEGECNEDCGRNGLPVDPDCDPCKKDEDCGSDVKVCEVDTGVCIPAPFTPGGEGADCERDEACDSGICAGNSEGKMCTSKCSGNDDCFDGFDCVEAGENGETSVCWPLDAGGGDDGLCSATGAKSGIPLTLLIALAALVGLRRRKQILS